MGGMLVAIAGMLVAIGVFCDNLFLVSVRNMST